MNTERARVGWGFWLWWVLASSAGLAVAFPVAFAVLRGVIGVGAVGFAVAGAVIGASLGIAQWLVLRRRVSWAGWWVLASSVGFAVGIAVSIAVRMAVGIVMAGAGAGAVAGAVIGASLGIAQWLVLRRQVSWAGWWVLASIVGFAVIEAVAFAVLRGVIEGMAFAVAGYEAITGGALVWLLRQPPAQDPIPSQDAA